MNRVPKVKSESFISIEKKARKFLQKCVPNYTDCEPPEPIPIRRILEKYLYEYYNIDFEVNDNFELCEGVTIPQERKIVLSSESYEKLCRNDYRTRFTAAHEIGHAILHIQQFENEQNVKFENRNDIKLYRKKDIPPYQNPEWQANSFASALLMPTEYIYEFISNNYDNFNFVIGDMHFYLNVSYTAAKIRYDNFIQRIR